MPSMYICLVNTEVKRKNKSNPAKPKICSWLEERKSIAVWITKGSQQSHLLGLVSPVEAFVTFLSQETDSTEFSPGCG